MSQILSLYAEVFKTTGKYYSEVVASHVKQLSELDSILPPSSTFVMMTNTSTSQYEFISKNIECATGLKRDDLYTFGIKFFLSKVHKDDLNTWVFALKDLMHFCMAEVKECDRTKMNFQYNYRLQVGANKVVNVVENQIPLVLDQSGKPIIGLGHFTVYDDGIANPIKGIARQLNERQCYETVYAKTYSMQKLLEMLSNREGDILRLLALGNTSKEIGIKLFISQHTVDTHRRNILQKLGFSSTVEIVSFCRQSMFF